MKRFPRHLAACVPAIILLATSPIMGMASLIGDALPPRLPIPNPQPASTQGAAPTPQNVAIPATPAPSSTPPVASEQASTVAPQVQTGSPPTDAGITDCRRVEGSLLMTSPAVFRQIGMEQVWDVIERWGVVVAIIDSGMDANNPHLQGAMAPGADLLGRGNNQRNDSDHGTVAAGMIVVRQTEGSGVVGIAKNTTIMPVRVYQRTSGDQVKKSVDPTPTRTAKGIQWAADNGAKVIVVKRMLTQDEPEVQVAMNHATEVRALVVVGADAMGSTKHPSRGATASTPPLATDASGAKVRYLAVYSNVLGATSLDTSGDVSKDMLHDSHVDVAVPAQAVPTAFFEEGDCLASQNRSFPALAAGYATGVAALVMAVHPTETPADWKYRLTTTAIRPEPTKSSPVTGWGLIVPYTALNLVSNSTAVGPENPRGAHPVPMPSPGLLKPIIPNPAPWHQARLAGGIGATGLVALSLGLMTSGTRGRKQA